MQLDLVLMGFLASTSIFAADTTCIAQNINYAILKE